ncbi:DUF72 domain-containing protein [Sphingobium sp. H39-3-25]|uniref:DUF72 domain-containing protein n=1 Tax=Sphingobium arseniciresistens TaxID=3030834 RepID=UPI0023B93B57|nr:DUF72 domain-containing protein [Sphingobium arseniciresistens]
MGDIRIGIGGWTYVPWRGSFYPDDLRQKDELAYVGAHLTATEINATYYSTQKPQTFANWAKAVPDGFRFAVKASRFCTNRRILAEAGPSIEKFVGQGIVELGDRLGPILWQFMPTKKFDAEDFGAFLSLLPGKVDGVPLSHAVEARHQSFDDPAFYALARKAGVAVVVADHAEYPRLKGAEEGAAPFTYARLMQSQEDEPAGYAADDLATWASWTKTRAESGDCYIFFISGAKVRNPAAAMALMERVAE